MANINWSAAEIEIARTIVAKLDEYTSPRRAALDPRVTPISPSDASHLASGIRSTRLVSPTNFVPVRHLFRVLGFDESRPFQWRLEHKLIHTLLLRHYAPGVVPRTCGLRRYVASRLKEVPTSILADELTMAGYIKPAVGSGSDPDNRKEAAVAIQATLADQRPTDEIALHDERWVIQERLSLVTEYRVHSVEDAVVPTLTCLRHSDRPLKAEREEPNAFVATVLQALPNAFLHQSLCGWDIGRTADGRLHVLEINWGGFHPVGEVGFQCSGYLAQDAWGAYRVAKLIRFLEDQYGIQIVVTAPSAPADTLSVLYVSIHRWLMLLKVAGLARTLSSAMSDVVDCSPVGQESSEQTRAHTIILRMLEAKLSTIGGLVE